MIRLTLEGDMSMSGILRVDSSMTVKGNSTMEGGWRMKGPIYYNDEPTELIPAFGQTSVVVDARNQNLGPTIDSLRSADKTRSC